METYTYICAYCSKEYTPRRRRVQKYCSNTCRVKAHFYRTKQSSLNTNKEALIVKNSNKSVSESQNKQKINLAGIGNAAIANFATDTLKDWFTSEDQKPATKADLKNMLNEFRKRYQEISNIPIRPDGSKAFYDNQTKKVVYLKPKSPWMN